MTTFSALIYNKCRNRVPYILDIITHTSVSNRVSYSLKPGYYLPCHIMFMGVNMVYVKYHRFQGCNVPFRLPPSYPGQRVHMRHPRLAAGEGEGGGVDGETAVPPAGQAAPAGRVERGRGSKPRPN